MTKVIPLFSDTLTLCNYLGGGRHITLSIWVGHIEEDSVVTPLGNLFDIAISNILIAIYHK